MITKEQVDRLHNNEDFAHFIDGVNELREEWIRCLWSAPPEEMPRIAGRIAAYDQLLIEAEADKLSKRYDLSVVNVKKKRSGWWPWGK